MSKPEPVRVFISYRHADEPVRQLVRRQLAWLENEQQVHVFDDRNILASDDWDKRIREELEQAQLIVLVITAAFMESRYCTQVELKNAIKRRADVGTRIIPIIAEDCYWEVLPIQSIAALPKDANNNLKPLNKWGRHKDTALKQIAQHAHAIVDILKTGHQPAIDLAHYRRRAQERWSAVDLTLLVQPGRDNPDAAPIRLQDVFIPQACRRSRPPQVLPRDYRERHGKPEEPEPDLDRHWQASPREPVLDLLAAPEVRRLVLLGDPGAGKSALARYLLLALLDETPPADAAWLHALRPRTPFLIELRDYVAREAAGECRDLLGYLGWQGSCENLGFDAAAVRGTIGRAPALLILDGLDEIFDRDRRERLIHEIVGLANQPELRVLVTSRIAGFKEHRFKAADFLTATLDDLDDGQIQAFAQGWFRLAWQSDPARAAAKRAELLQTLKDRPPLRPLAGNPLLLTVMALVLRHQSLARTRIGLYDQCVRLLCHHWDFEQNLHAAKHKLVSGLNDSDKETLLRHVALAMQTAPDGLQANAIGAEALEQVLSDYFASAWSADPAEARNAARELAELLQTRNWMLCPRGPGLFGFVHRTFLEYLVARALLVRLRAHEISLDQLITDHALAHAEDENWHEIIPLLAALLGEDGPALAGKLIDTLIPVVTEVAAHPISLGLSFRAASELDVRLLPKLSTVLARLEEGLRTWFLQTDNSDRFTKEGSKLAGRMISGAFETIGRDWPRRERILERLGLDAVEQCAASTSLQFILEALLSSVLGDLDDVLQLARTGGSGELRGVALAALTRSRIGDIDVLNFVRDRAEKDPDPSTRSHSLFALAVHVADDPDTHRFVRDRALRDPDPSPRAQALMGLGIRAATDPNILKFVRDRAQNDPDPLPRAFALPLLATIAHGDPECLRLIRERAENDPHSIVRVVALPLLATLAASDPGLLRFIRGRCELDPDPLTRGRALQVVARHAAIDPDALGFVRERAQNDPEPGPRAEALGALAKHAAGDPDTLRFARERAMMDEDGNVRGAGLLAWAQTTAEHSTAVLVSHDLDAVMPGLDLSKPIDEDRVQRAVAELGLTYEEVRTRYEVLAGEFPLRLAWREP